jgi:hypothetical protein
LTDSSELRATTRAGAERPRLSEKGDMTAMQDVEAAVGKHQRAWQDEQARCDLAGGNDLAFEGRQAGR